MKPEEVDWENLPELDGLKLREQRPSGALWDALQQFVQLKHSELADFRKRYPNFLPAWFYPDMHFPHLRPYFKLRGDPDEPKPAVIMPDDPDAHLPHVWPQEQGAEGSKLRLDGWQVWQRLLLNAWRATFHPEYVAQLVNIPTAAPDTFLFEVQPVYDAQRAVLALALQPWRARFCPKCGRPFVARQPRDTYWPRECGIEHREISKAAWKKQSRQLKRKTRKPLPSRRRQRAKQKRDRSTPTHAARPNAAMKAFF